MALPAYIAVGIIVIEVLLVFLDCYKVGGFKVDGISTASELSGCTVIKANIEIEIRAGPSKVFWVFLHSSHQHILLIFNVKKYDRLLNGMFIFQKAARVLSALRTNSVQLCSLPML